MMFSRVMSSLGDLADLAPVAQHRDPVADRDQFVELGRRHQQRQALLAQLADQRHDLRVRADVDAARRLVENEDARVGDQRARQHDLLLVAARQLADRLVGVGRGDRQRLDHLLRQLLLLVVRQPPQPAALGLQRQDDVLAHGEFAR